MRSFIAACALAAIASAKNFAVVVATSSGFTDYRHQSDAHRMYKTLIA
jgi:glycosylphosphatidylinositol transamidase (GPIT) subunit GPI8